MLSDKNRINLLVTYTVDKQFNFLYYYHKRKKIGKRKELSMGDYSLLTDEELVSLCRKNDEAAWSELYARYLAVSKSLCKKFKLSAIDSDDLVQEGMIGFLSAVHAYKSDKEASFSTFAHACMKNKITSTVKSNLKKGNVPMNACRPLTSARDVADSALTPEERLIAKNDAVFANHLVSTVLTEKEHNVLSAYLCGKSYDEISKQLSMSKKAVDGALQRAKKKIRTEFEN